jgi:hypothetical protein
VATAGAEAILSQVLANGVSVEVQQSIEDRARREVLDQVKDWLDRRRLLFGLTFEEQRFAHELLADVFGVKP